MDGDLEDHSGCAAHDAEFALWIYDRRGVSLHHLEDLWQKDVTNKIIEDLTSSKAQKHGRKTIPTVCLDYMWY